MLSTVIVFHRHDCEMSQHVTLSWVIGPIRHPHHPCATIRPPTGARHHSSYVLLLAVDNTIGVSSINLINQLVRLLTNDYQSRHVVDERRRWWWRWRWQQLLKPSAWLDVVTHTQLIRLAWWQNRSTWKMRQKLFHYVWYSMFILCGDFSTPLCITMIANDNSVIV